MRQPSTVSLDPDMRQAARGIAERLAAGGHRAWIVGGAVRDLALGRPVTDVDMATTATPDEIEGLFEATKPVGRAFGTVLVPLGRIAVQLTTLRAEGAYSDGRHPDHVRFGTTVEEDAARRDFTCNALFLDPLDDTLLDPEGGLADLAAKRLRSVGDPMQRFGEDGLRLVRMARFAAALELEADPEVLEAARQSAANLDRISRERILAELERIFGGPDPVRAIAILRACDLLGRSLPGLEELQPHDLDPDSAADLRLAALEQLGPAPGLAAGLCVLVDPSPADPGARPGDFDAAMRVLERIKTSRETRRLVSELWRLEREAGALLSGALGSRARKLRLVRCDAWPLAARLLAAWISARGEDPSALDALREFGTSVPREEQFPPALLGPADLEAQAIERGPLWGTLLAEAEERQLDGHMSTRAEALLWLEKRAR